MAKQRIHKYDNLKGLAITLIVLGHMLFLIKLPYVAWIRYTISIFHLPIFFFVAGYFSKIRPGEVTKSFKRLIIPYIVTCLVYSAYLLILGSKINIPLIYPTFAMWFLTALFAMKVLLPVVDRLRYPILVTFIIALLIGFVDIDPNILGITRFFTFYPVFLIGFYYNKHKSILDKKITSSRYFLILAAMVTFTLCALAAKAFTPDIIVLAKCYTKPSDLIRRAIVMILGIAMTLILTRLVSNRDYILTKIGRNSMAIYLLHVFIVTLLIKIFTPILKGHEFLSIAFAVVSTVIIVLVLSPDRINDALNKLFDYIFNLITKLKF